MKSTRNRRGRALQATMAKKEDEKQQPEIKTGSCNEDRCGNEAACSQLPNNTYQCLCPHDFSIPELSGDPLKLRCPNRKIVSESPPPIPHIIPPSRNSSSVGHNMSISPQLLGHVAARSPVVLGGALLTILGASLLLVMLGASVCWWKRRDFIKFMGRTRAQRKAASCNFPRSLNKRVLVAAQYASNPQYFGAGGELPELPPPPPSCTVPLIERAAISLHKELGEGHFGKVYRGELIRAAGGVEQVAVKILKTLKDLQAMENFMREVEAMSGFKHPNVLALIGVVHKDAHGEPWMVLEFMPHGDLAEVLRSNSPQLWRPIPGLPPLGPAELHSLALQIADGMCYLAAQHFVHRDLAARNCLVGTGLTVKIADFGLSRDVYTCDYYKVPMGSSRTLPIRWMAPENIQFYRFTLESDVWSYGVVLWEIYSFARQPYFGNSNEEVMKLLNDGILLIPPPNCPPLIRDLMQRCWKSSPRDRIKFSEIHQILLKAATPNPPLPPPSLPTFLPLPPSTGLELLDADSYLLPNVVTPPEYLETLSAV